MSNMRQWIELCEGQQVSEASPPVKKNHIRLYRGDSTSIKKFSTDVTSLYSMLGQGIYLTDNKRVAGDYRSKGPSGDVLFRLAGRNLTKQAVLDFYLRRLARKLDADGVDHSSEIRYWTSDVPYSDGGDFSTPTNDLRRREHEQRMAHAMAKWKALSKDYVIRIKFGDEGVIEKKPNKAAQSSISMFDVPEAYVARAFHADNPIDDRVLSLLDWALRHHGDNGTANDVQSYVKQQEWEDERPSFREVYGNLTRESPIVHDRQAQAEFREGLADLGYVGIEYTGGVTMGGGVRHRAFVFWDDKAINRYRV